MSTAHTPGGGLSAADHERIHELAEQGLTANRIAGQIGRHPSTVQWFMYREGLAAARQTDTPKTYWRNGRPCRQYGRDEDAVLLNLRRAGKSVGEIARAVSEQFGYTRTAHSVNVRLTALAGREDL